MLRTPIHDEHSEHGGHDHYEEQFSLVMYFYILTRIMLIKAICVAVVIIVVLLLMLLVLIVILILGTNILPRRASLMLIRSSQQKLQDEDTNCRSKSFILNSCNSLPQTRPPVRATISRMAQTDRDSVS